MIGWLATVQPSGRPHLVPVWFYCSADELLVTAMPGSQKVKNISANPAVSFSLDDSRLGHEPVLLEGNATVEPVTAQEPALVRYFEKYRPMMNEMNWTEEACRSTHSALIRVRVTRFVQF